MPGAHLAMLATLFAIDAEYDEPMRWQREAPAMRDALARAASQLRGRHQRGSIRKHKPAAQDLEGSDPRQSQLRCRAGREKLGLVEVPDRARADEAAGASPEKGPGRSWTLAAATWRAAPTQWSHEAQLIAALAEVIEPRGAGSFRRRDLSRVCRCDAHEAVALRDAIERKNAEQMRHVAGRD